MEYLQGVRDKSELKVFKSFLADLGFRILPITVDISNRAAALVEDFALSHSMRCGDAIVGATALLHGLPLATANAKHFRFIPAIDLKTIRV